MRGAFARRTIPNALRWIASTPRFGLKLRNAFFQRFPSSLLCLNLPLGSLLEEDEFELERGNWVQEAHKAITQKLAQLRRSITLDSADASASDRTFANQQRQRLFNEIQAEILKVFGPGRPDAGESEVYTGVLTRATTPVTGNARWTAAGSEFHEDYPVNAAGVAQDAAVLAQIEDVLAAFADADAFADAFESDGLFAAVNTDPDTESRLFIDPYPSPSEMFKRPRGKLSMVSATTDLTRFGAWSHQVSANAVSALAAQTYTRGDRGREFGAFAYSPLAPTAVYTSVNSRLYPARGASGLVTASYVGETVAAQGDLFYKGAVEATVYWDPMAVTDSKVRVEITDLAETETDLPLQIGRYQTDANDHLVGVEEVGSLTWTANINTADGVVKFSSSEAVDVGSAGPDPINYKPDIYNDRLRFGFSRDALGGGMYQNHYRLGVDADANNYRHFQGATSRNWGSLTLQNVRAGGITTAATAADRTRLTEEQNMLQMPRWVISGQQLNTTTSTSGSVRSWIFIYADGSSLHFTQQEASGPHATLSTLWGRAIGVDPARNPASLRAVYLVNDPTLAANNGEHLYTRRGSFDASGYPTAGGANGIGHPTAPNELFKSWVATRWEEGTRYVNIYADDEAERASTLDGMFVGQDADGPLGLIGNWTLTSDAFGVGETRGTIRGAFGAEFQP